MMMVPSDSVDFRAPVPQVEALGAVHFIAIGGAGMSAVARLMLDRGVEVSGSDAVDSAAMRALQARGATVYVGHDAAHLGKAATVVVSSAIRDHNPELVAARQAGLRVLHRAQALASLAADRRIVAVAGANGKSTTTAMTVTAMAGEGSLPTFAAGAELVQWGTNAATGERDLLVLEADESDGSFLAYRPQVAIVTNVQPDHLDHYGTFAAVQQAYTDFADTIRPGGLLVACQDDAGSAGLASQARQRGIAVLTYGLDPASDLRLTAVEQDVEGGAAALHWAGGMQRLTLPIPGVHNLLNAAAAFGAAVIGCGIDPGSALRGLGGFRGTRRRFEIVGRSRGIVVVDDYAHNPPKVAAAVATGRVLASGGRLHVIFQPHLFSRTRDFAEPFAKSLSGADRVVLLPIYAAREDPVDGVSSELIANPLRHTNAEVEIESFPDDPWLARFLDGVKPGDVVMTMGAGDVTRLAPRLARAIQGGGS